VFVLEICAGFHIGLNGEFLPGTPQRLAGIFFALKANGSMVGAVLGFSGLAWAHFFQAAHKLEPLKEEEREESESGGEDENPQASTQPVVQPGASISSRSAGKTLAEGDSGATSSRGRVAL
jgi:hypothetical protein